MPLFPIDLQTLFTQAPQVGKEQAAQKDAAPVAQSLQGAQLAQKTEQRDNDVNATSDAEEGPERVKDRDRGKPDRERRKTAPKRTAEAQPPARDVVRDPALGRNVDISG